MAGLLLVPVGLGVVGLDGGDEVVSGVGLFCFQKPIFMYPASLSVKYRISTEMMIFPNPERKWK